MSAPTGQRVIAANSRFACPVTGTDGIEHLVADGDYTAARVFGGPFRTLCVENITQAPLTVSGEPCPWCHAVADHAELADPMHINDGRVHRFVHSLKQAAGAE